MYEMLDMLSLIQGNTYLDLSHYMHWEHHSSNNIVQYLNVFIDKVIVFNTSRSQEIIIFYELFVIFINELALHRYILHR